jgi:hypothetical protein
VSEEARGARRLDSGTVVEHHDPAGASLADRARSKSIATSIVGLEAVDAAAPG